MHGLPQETQAKLDDLNRLKKLSNAHGGPYELLFGSSSVNPFDPPVPMTAHASSVIGLASLCMRKRKEPQTIAEVGVWQGQLSRWILTCLPFATLHMIDPWREPHPESSWYQRGDRFAKSPQEQHDAHYGLCKILADQFAPRAVLHREPSLQAVHDFEDGSLDLVFIDGAHDKENVMADIAAWWPKVRNGGYLSGHDYRPTGNYFGLVDGVHKAVDALPTFEGEYVEDGTRRKKHAKIVYSHEHIECYPGKVWAVRKNMPQPYRGNTFRPASPAPESSGGGK